ncbi:ATP-binding protein [Kitasatospora indigofera]|uniref:ATP-binding protein n=1 Tax=Kitasatospora indigofera TaxID=67307 RepID=A0A919D974_9ACTN|nr:ATP-binding protein [Kitasatospora indigofera]GHE26359.1 ATP-binding protein [Kitasatospora indigofera]
MDAIATSPTEALIGPPDSRTGSTGTRPPERCADAQPGPGDTVWELPHSPESAGAARRITRDTLGAWGMDEGATDQALIVVSELVTNAVEHALPPIALHLGRAAPGGALHIEVDDGGPAAQEGGWTATCPADEHGRGGAIVAVLATSHGCRAGEHGVTYWADL